MLEEIDRAAEEQVTLYVPPPAPHDRAKAGSEYLPKKSDSPAQARWRERMAGEEAKVIYKQRASTSETANADLKQHRGLTQLAVRGLAKARSVALTSVSSVEPWCALGYNLLHFGGTLLM